MPFTVIPEMSFHGSSAMQAESGEMMAVRREMLQLLRQQIEALDSRLGLTDARLSECYERQRRVQELRERLQALSNSKPGAGSTRDEEAEAPSCAGQVMPTSRYTDSAANV